MWITRVFHCWVNWQIAFHSAIWGADVTLPLGELGLLKLCGFSGIQGEESTPPRVVPPARKGEHRFFEVVLLIGKIRKVGQSWRNTERRRALKAVQVRARSAGNKLDPWGAPLD
jgi:hypothetical protein